MVDWTRTLKVQATQAALLEAQVSLLDRLKAQVSVLDRLQAQVALLNEKMSLLQPLVAEAEAKRQAVDKWLVL